MQLRSALDCLPLVRGLRNCLPSLHAGTQVLPLVAPLEEVLSRWAAREPTPLGRRDLTDACIDAQARMEFGHFLHQELRVRFARRVCFLRALPFGLPEFPGIRALTRAHASYVSDLEECRAPKTLSDARDFATLLRHIIAQQSYFEEDLFSSFRDFSKGIGSSCMEVRQAADAILHRLVAANIGTKVLMSHYVSSQRNREGHVGVVDLRCDPADVARLAAKQCKNVCKAELDKAPEITVRSRSPGVFPLVPGYLHYSLSEVLKNACRAVVERHAGGALPAVTVDVEHGTGRVGFWVLDQGGGMLPEAQERAMQFLHTTCKSFYPEGVGAGPAKSALAGFGIGLPTARLFARHFGGDLQLNSMAGVGTEAHVIFNTCGSCLEPLASFSHGLLSGVMADGNSWV